ncbi:MAG: nucleotide sugar dehydrogenase [Candidatus Diapherotrites archaeon]|uniref:UDP-N-acetyl-D-mannosamine dehydrogenase n=1 Tax=Candidatus Iainarchaeum sp. TaxID=3101447 RepID=A0A938YMR7_9ARCH|nr:nucleotide sugar dehydrogenase [Candidatus Diapherotrites archaeon]
MAKKVVCVVGLGYVGLPLALLCAEKGFRVKGLDSDRKKVALIARGKSPIKDKELERKVKKLRRKISASASAKDALQDSDIIVVCVPTPAKGSKPDLRPLKAACMSIAKHFPAGKKPLLVIESTVYPGTVRHVVKPIIEGKKLEAGKDFFLAHCPERIDPGNRKWQLKNIPRVFAALTPKGKARGLAFYKKILNAKVICLANLEEAEAVKVVENTFRDINIAFVNELAKSFEMMGIDLSEVLKGASSKPFGFMPFWPGPGVGGHCISQDPYYLIARAQESGFTHRFLQLAREINNSMPKHVVSLIMKSLRSAGIKPKKAKVVVLGLSYKPDVDDSRESPAIKVIELLRRRGVNPVSHDPFLLKMSNAKSFAKAVKNADCVVVATHHSQFIKRLTPAFLKRNKVRAVIDARNVLDKDGIIKKEILYFGIGR